jgi:hypothetical protein
MQAIITKAEDTGLAVATTAGTDALEGKSEGQIGLDAGKVVLKAVAP